MDFLFSIEQFSELTYLSDSFFKLLSNNWLKCDFFLCMDVHVCMYVCNLRLEMYSITVNSVYMCLFILSSMYTFLVLILVLLLILKSYR